MGSGASALPDSFSALDESSKQEWIDKYNRLLKDGLSHDEAVTILQDQSTAPPPIKSVKKSLKRQASGLSAQDKVAKLKQKNAEAISNLKGSLSHKKKMEASRLKARLEKKKNKAVNIMVDRGMPKQQAEDEAVAEMIKEEEAIETVQNMYNEENSDDPSSYEMSMAIDMYLPLMVWLFDWVKDLGGDPNSEDNNGLTILMLAVQIGEARLVEQFAEKGCDVNAKASDDSSPIHIAAQWGHSDVLETLVGMGADINVENDDGWTPLIFAAIGGHKSSIDMCLKYGADVNHLDADLYSALVYAEEAGHSDCVEVIKEAVHVSQKSIMNAPDTPSVGDGGSGGMVREDTQAQVIESWGGDDDNDD